MKNNFIEVNNLVKTFPIKGSRKKVNAINNISFSIPKSQTLGLVGESGSGKTTAGRCLLRLLEPDSGEIYFNGKPVHTAKKEKLRDLRKKTQIVFQNPYESLDPRFSILESMIEPLKIWKIGNKKQMVERAYEMAERVGLKLDSLDNIYPHQLSGGEQQKAGVARAIITNPDFIVLDEPTSLLDSSARAEITDLLINLQRDLKVTFLFISHDLTAVRHLSTKIAITYLGQIVEMGETEELFKNPLHPYSQALLSSVLYPDPTSKCERQILKGEIPSPIDLPKGCFLFSRCPIRQEQCSNKSPDLVEVTDEHYVRCFNIQ